MAHIQLPQGLPGIIGPMKAYPETAKPLNDLAEILLVQDTPTFPKADRETVASYVSYLNNCLFCSESHGAVADYFHQNPNFSREIWANTEKAGERLKSLLKIAAQVQKEASSVKKEDIDRAKSFGATEKDIHDTVLIAAAFCMYNRYVDGLGTFAPPKGDPAYREIGEMLGKGGYRNPIK